MNDANLQQPAPDPDPKETSAETPAGASRGWAFLVPVLVIGYAVLSVYAVNRAEVAVGQTVRPLLVGTAVAVGLTALLWAFARGRDVRRAAASASVLLLAFFTPEVVGQFVISPMWRAVAIIPYAALMGLWYGAWVALALWVLRTRRDVSAAVTLAAVVGGALLVPNLPPALAAVWTGLRTGQWGTAQDARAAADARERAATAPAAPPARTPTLGTSPAASDAPDLFVLVLDGYGRQDVLQTLYGVDNEPFVRGLSDLGFSVARESRANYIQTVLALESSLNLEYLTHSDTDPINFGVSRIQKSEVATTLRARGYQVVYVATGFPLSGSGYADILQEPELPVADTFTPLERVVLDRTPLAPLMVNEHAAFDRHRMKLLAGLTAFGDAAKLPGPKFVLAHILAPHPPFVFGERGEPTYPSVGIFKIGDATDFLHNASPEEYRKGYAGQVRYLNTRVLEALTALRKNATRPAVIVIMGDHGPRRQTDWGSLARTNVHEAFYNLIAVSAPPAYARTVAAATTGDTTPVSVFRRLFTDIYDSPHPAIPDRSYYSTLAFPYRFTDVTARVAGQKAEDARPAAGAGR